MKQETISFNYHSKESHQSAGSGSRPFSMAKFPVTALSCGGFIRATTRLLCVCVYVCCTTAVICYLTSSLLRGFFSALC